MLANLLEERRREALQKAWPSLPPWVFCSSAGTIWDAGNMSRRWERVWRKAHARGVRPLKLHAARHTWATLAFLARKSPRWVADQLGHADPALTLRFYAHALREEETDLSFAEFNGREASLSVSRFDEGTSEPRKSPKTGAPGMTRTCDTRFRNSPRIVSLSCSQLEVVEMAQP